MNSKNFKLIVTLNIVITIITVLLFMRNYRNYQAMPEALNKESFLYMIAIEVIALIGLVLLFFNKKAGLFVYVISIILLVLYPLITGTADTVLGLLILPVLLIPAGFIFYYIKVLKSKAI